MYSKHSILFFCAPLFSAKGNLWKKKLDQTFKVFEKLAADICLLTAIIHLSRNQLKQWFESIWFIMYVWACAHNNQLSIDNNDSIDNNELLSILTVFLFLIS